MKIEEVHVRDDHIINQLADVWKDSVKNTHHFLSEDDILMFYPHVKESLKKISKLIVVYEQDAIGFMGINDENLDMLFLSSQAIGQGIGRVLIEKAIADYGVKELCVNEQNNDAFYFYQHMGFKEYKREMHDQNGLPFPLIYMRY